MNQKLFLTEDQVKDLQSGFVTIFGTEPQRYFSAPGRTEIGGNHTDHQRGHVLAAAVNLDTIAAVACNDSNYIRVQSAGYPMCQVDITDLTPKAEEINWVSPKISPTVIVVLPEASMTPPTNTTSSVIIGSNSILTTESKSYIKSH